MLPPHELKNKDFSHSIRGYNTIEVDEHIKFVIEKYTELYRRNDELEKELKTTQSRLEELQANEDAIRRAMVNAQRTEHKIVTEANERADLIMRTAKHNCDKVLVDFKNKISTERVTLHKLRQSVAEFKEKTLEQYKTHLEYVEQISPDLDSEPEWELTEEDYANDLLEQMKIEISQSVNNSFTEQKIEPQKAEKPSEKENVQTPINKKAAKKFSLSLKDNKPSDQKTDPTPDEAEPQEGTTILFDAISKSAVPDKEEETDAQNDAPTIEIDPSEINKNSDNQ